MPPSQPRLKVTFILQSCATSCQFVQLSTTTYAFPFLLIIYASRFQHIFGYKQRILSRCIILALHEDKSSTNQECRCNICRQFEQTKVECRDCDNTSSGLVAGRAGGRPGARTRTTACGAGGGRRRVGDGTCSCGACLAEHGLAAVCHLWCGLLSRTRKVTGIRILGICGSLVEIVHIIGPREPLLSVAHGVRSIHARGGISSDTFTIVANGWITYVIELSLERCVGETSFCDTRQIGYHAAACTSIRCRWQARHGFPCRIE